MINMISVNKKYKYLVTNGCSQTLGSACVVEETWPVKLAQKLKLELINLAVPGTGWYHIQNSTMSFIQNNKEILDDCFFIFQISMLERRVNYKEIPIFRTDIWEKWNIKYLSANAVAGAGYIDWEKYSDGSLKPEGWDINYPQFTGPFKDPESLWPYILFFPEHRHYPDGVNNWKIDKAFQNNRIPPYIEEQFEELMIYWGREISSFHLFIKNIGLDHIMVDGYTPFLSHELNFENYYENLSEFEFIKSFWDKKPMEHDLSEIMLYDFKNIKGKWLYDLVDEKYKITDTILWNAYINQYGDEWSPDGGHAGPLGMNRIVNMIEKNLIKKNWFIYNEK